FKDVGNDEPKSATDYQKHVEDGPHNKSDEKDKSEDDSSPKKVNAAGQHINIASPEVITGHFKLNTVDPSVNTTSLYDLDSPKDMFNLGASHTLKTTQVEFFSNKDEPEVDLGNITNSYTVPTTPNTRIHKDHPIKNVIGDVKKALVKDGDADEVDVHLYRSMIRSLMYLTTSRLDIMFVVCACARFQVIPKTSHLLAIKRIFRYLKGKPTLGLWYSRNSPFELVAYIDSDYAGATHDRKSTAGGCQFLGNKLISWQCKKQTMVATFTTEAEYVAAANLLIKGFDVGRFQYLVSSIGMLNWHIKRGRDTKIPQSSGPPDKGSGPRCQDTILGDVNAQTRFEIASKQSNDPPLSRGYTLGSGEDSNCQVHARNDLYLDDQKEVLSVAVSAPTAWKYFIHTITQCLSAKSTAWNEFSSSMASLIICLATNHKFNLSKYIFNAMVKHLDEGVKFLMYPRFLQVFINQQLRDMSTHKKIFVNPFYTKKVFANMKRAGKDFSGRITPLFDNVMVQVSEEVGEDLDHPTDSTQIPIIDQPSSSSQPQKKQPSKKAQRQEAEVPQDETEHEESIPTPSNDPQPSGKDSMQLTDLMVLCTKLQTQVHDLEKAKDAQAKEIAALKKRIQRLERKKMSRPTGLKRLGKVGMSSRIESSKDQESLGDPENASKKGRTIADIDDDVEVTLVDETQERQDDELMFDTGVLEDDEMPLEAKVDEKDEQSTKPDDSTVGEAVTTTSVEDKEQRLARKQEEEANIELIESWENRQAMIEADRLMAERLQSKEREELTDEEKAKLFMELMEKRRKHFAALRAQEKRNRPPTKAQKRTQMSTYLKHMGGYTYKQLNGKSFDEIQKLFDKEMKRVIPLWLWVLRYRKAKKRRKKVVRKQLKVAERRCLEGKEQGKNNNKNPQRNKKWRKKKSRIKADGSSKRYSSMIRMLQGIDKEDLEALWRIVKAMYGDIRPENEFVRVLWGDLKVMFVPDKRSDVWRILQGYMVTIWKLIDSSGVYFLMIGSKQGPGLIGAFNRLGDLDSSFSAIKYKASPQLTMAARKSSSYRE
ncbi:hypothetical protein Tco_1156313, partial [Tanacetum coccineum]